MLAHGLAIDPSRTLRCPASSKVSTAPLGLVTSLSFNRRCKEKNKVFINVDRYTKYSTPFCYAQRNARIIPLATASFGDMADSTRPGDPGHQPRLRRDDRKRYAESARGQLLKMAAP